MSRRLHPDGAALVVPRCWPGSPPSHWRQQRAAPAKHQPPTLPLRHRPQQRSQQPQLPQQPRLRQYQLLQGRPQHRAPPRFPRSSGSTLRSSAAAGTTRRSQRASRWRCGSGHPLEAPAIVKPPRSRRQVSNGAIKSRSSVSPGQGTKHRSKASSTSTRSRSCRSAMIQAMCSPTSRFLASQRSSSSIPMAPPSKSSVPSMRSNSIRSSPTSPADDGSATASYFG